MPKFLQEWAAEHMHNGADPNLVEVALLTADACSAISRRLRTSALEGLVGATGNMNIQGEVQKPLDVIANQLFLDACKTTDSISYAVSEELDCEVLISTSGKYALIFDPLDGSSNLDVNVTVGSIFSVLPATVPEDLLQVGRKQVFAGFASYGPATSLFITFGHQVDLFTLNSEQDWELTRSGITVPDEYREFAINHSRQRFWLAETRSYIDDCLSGEEGPAGKRYNSRWVGSMVAEIQRILTRGGVFLYPLDKETSKTGGRLRLLYEANPIAFLLAAAGGIATTGRENILDLLPQSLHQRVPVIAGSMAEVFRASGYYSRMAQS